MLPLFTTFSHGRVPHTLHQQVSLLPTTTMPLFRDENFLIVHAGSEQTLLLFGLRDALTPPQYKFPTVVYLDKSTKQYRAANPSGAYEEIRPIVGSRVVDVDAFEALLKFVLQTIVQRHPILTINQIPLLLVAPSLSYSRGSVEHVTRFVFETLELTAFNVLDLSVAATIGYGASTALVVNIGHEASQVMPVVGGTCVRYAGRRIEAGGITIDEDLATLLPNLTKDQIRSLKTSSVYEVLNNHEGGFYLQADLAEDKASDDFDVARIVTGEEEAAPAPEEARANSELERNLFVDNAGNSITVGKERFQGASRLISVLAEAIHESLELVPDVDKRQECYDNIVFLGGTSNISGLKQAVVLRLCEDYLTKPPPSKKKSKNDANGVNSAIAAYQQTDDTGETSEPHGPVQVPASIKLAKHPEYFPEWKQPKHTGGSWSDVHVLGAEIYAKQVFGANSNHGGDLFIDTDVYEERGPQAVWDVTL